MKQSIIHEGQKSYVKTAEYQLKKKAIVKEISAKYAPLLLTESKPLKKSVLHFKKFWAIRTALNKLDKLDNKDVLYASKLVFS